MPDTEEATVNEEVDDPSPDCDNNNREGEELADASELSERQTVQLELDAGRRRVADQRCLVEQRREAFNAWLTGIDQRLDKIVRRLENPYPDDEEGVEDQNDVESQREPDVGS